MSVQNGMNAVISKVLKADSPANDADDSSPTATPDERRICRQVRELQLAQPPYLILLTALQDKGSVVTGLRAGADDFVHKPFDPNE